MRFTLSLLAASALIARGWAFDCIYGGEEQLSSLIACGDSNFIADCLLEEYENDRLALLRQCFIDGGCSDVDADTEYLWLESRCGSSSSGIFEDFGDLKKKRADDNDDNDTTTSTEATKTTATKKSTETEESTTKTDTATTTTDDASTTDSTTTSTTESTTSTDSTTDTTLTTSTTSTSSTDSTTSTSTSGSTTTSTSSTSSSTSTTSTYSLQCYTTNSVSTSVCATTSNSETCTATYSLSSACASGLYCTTDTAGNDVCMEKDDNLTTSGTVATIVLGTFLLGFIGSLITMAWRAKRKEAVAQAPAAFSSKQERVSLLGHSAAPAGSDLAKKPLPGPSPLATPSVSSGNVNPFGEQDIAYQSQTRR